MNNRILTKLGKELILLDGSMGIMLQKNGMPTGVSPEAFCLENPAVVRKIHQEYLTAGSDIIYTSTFGANYFKLKNYGLEKKTAEINRRLAEVALEAARTQNAWVAGDIGPTGVFFKPFGEQEFEKGISCFAEQIQALEQAGVDLLVVETQIDIQEARIALLAAKEYSRLPVIVSMSFDDNQRTLTGSDPLTCLNILQSLGADGFGINCSLGPDKLLPMIASIAPYTKIPLLVKPNAGLPMIKDGETVFPLQPGAFAEVMEKFLDLGVRFYGGCCGTTPEHIRELSHRIKHAKPKTVAVESEVLLFSSPRKTISISRLPKCLVGVVGERINPTGKKELQAQLRTGDFSLVKAMANDQREKGADLIDVNIGMPGIDEQATMLAIAEMLAVANELPICIDSSNPEVIAAVARFYPGRVLINSLSGEKLKAERLIPIIKKYGTGFIILPVDDNGVPETYEKRVRILLEIIEACEGQGIARQDGIVDALVMTIAANQQHAVTTLDLIEYASQELGLNTVIGLSNISFGLPQRDQLNAAFLAMAMGKGLSLVIANPSNEGAMAAKRSGDALLGRDTLCRNWIQHASGISSKIAIRDLQAPVDAITVRALIHEDVLQGEKNRIERDLQRGLELGIEPFALVQEIMVPAIQQVGERFNSKEYFLPQLIAAAEAMEKGVQFLKPRLEQLKISSKGTIILATVKGDIHDIGKSIVGLLLKNNGYEVVDLGKSVDEQTIVETAIVRGAHVIGLSALMTTTMIEMKKVITLAREKIPAIKVMVGGAVVTQRYADEIGADGFAADAGQCPGLVDGLLQR